MDNDFNNELFVGCVEELKQLHQILDKTLECTCQVVFVPGEAGTGKTWLIERFLKEVEDRSGIVFIARGKCTTESELSGLSPFAQVLGDLYSVSKEGKKYSSTDEEFKRALLFLKEVGPAWVDMFTMGVVSAIKITLEESIKLFSPQPDTARNLFLPQTSAFSQRTVFEQFANLVGKKAEEHPVIIFLDDVQWIDQSSLDLLYYLSRTSDRCPIMIIAAYRPTMALKNKSNFRDKRVEIVRFGAYELPELEKGIDVIAYAAKRYPRHEFPNSFLKMIQNHTLGYPLFVTGIFDWMQHPDQKIIVAEKLGDSSNNIKWRLGKDLNSLEHIPKSMDAVLEYRLDRLEENLRGILNCASVEGEDFTVQVIAQLRKMDEMDLLDSLEALEQQYHLVHEGKEIEISIEKIIYLYKFGHRLFRDYLYGKLSHVRKKILHLQVAECLEVVYSDKLSLIASNLANHYQLAHRPDKVCYFGLLAAQTAYNSYSWAESIKWAKTVLEQLKRTDKVEIDVINYQTQAVVIWEKCIERLGDDFDEVIRELENVVGLLNKGSDANDLLASALLALGWAYYYGPGLETYKVPRQALLVAEELGNMTTLYEAKYLLAQVLMDDAGKYEEALNILKDQLNLAVKLGDTNRHADTLASLSWCYMYLGCFQEGIVNGNKALEILNTCSEPDPLIEGFALRALGGSYQGNGNYDLALQSLDKSIEVYGRVGDMVQLNWTNSEKAETLYEMHQFSEAFDISRDVISFADITKDYPLVFWGNIVLTDLNIEKGDLSSAELSLSESIRAYSKYDSIVDEIKLNTTSAIFYREKDDYQQCQEYIDATISLMKGIESKYPLLVIYDVYGTLLQAKGEFHQAEKWYQDSLKLSEELNAQSAIATTCQHTGSLHLQAKESEKAREYYARALKIRQDLHHYWMISKIEELLDKLG